MSGFDEDSASEPLEGVEACAFDAYGTLFDVHSAVAALADRVGPEHARLSAEWRRRQLEYTWLRTLSRAHADFRTVTADALAVSMRALGLGDPGDPDDPDPPRAGTSDDDASPAALHGALMRAYDTLEPFPEVAGTLAALRRAGLPCAILSNGTPAMLDAAVRGAGLGDAFAHVLSVESLGTYKPDPHVYALATDAFGLSPARVAFLSSNAWDAAGAARFGLRTVWVNRLGAPREALPGAPERVLGDLTGLPGLLGVG